MEPDLRRLLRAVLAAALPGPRGGRRIVVAGLPRSGTSWLAKCISLAEGVSYYYEPDRPLVERRPENRNRYLAEHRDDPVLEREIDRMFRGKVHGDYQIAEKALADLLRTPFCDTVLLKWVWLSLALDWLSPRFPEVRVVQVFRHPVPQFLSWQQRDWRPERALQRLLDQDALTEGPLAPFAHVMRDAESYWEKAGAFWGAMAYMQLKSHRTGWVLREHEWYCLDPERRIRWLIETLGLRWNERISEFLHPGRHQAGPGYGEARDPRSEVDKWRGRVGAQELRELEEGLRPFELPFYRALDPERFWTPPDVGSSVRGTTGAPF